MTPTIDSRCDCAFISTSLFSQSGSSGPTKVIGKPTRTPDGLEYWDIQTGTGAEAKPGNTMAVHYTGWLRNRAKFDSSVDNHKPLEFKLGAGKVIKGWDEGVAGMKVEPRYQLASSSQEPQPLAFTWPDFRFSYRRAFACAAWPWRSSVPLVRDADG